MDKDVREPQADSQAGPWLVPANSLSVGGLRSWRAHRGQRTRGLRFHHNKDLAGEAHGAQENRHHFGDTEKSLGPGAGPSGVRRAVLVPPGWGVPNQAGSRTGRGGLCRVVWKALPRNASLSPVRPGEGRGWARVGV